MRFRFRFDLTVHFSRVRDVNLIGPNHDVDYKIPFHVNNVAFTRDHQCFILMVSLGDVKELRFVVSFV